MFKEYNSDNNVMIDLETLGSETSSVITSIGLVQFNPYTGETFKSLKLDISIDSSLMAGAKVSGSTILWWMGQEELARTTLIEGQKTAVNLFTAITKITNFFEENFDTKEVKVWGNGSSFDLSILINSYNLLGAKEPWMHYNERDVRTIVSFNPEIKSNLKFEGIKHDPIADCIHQVKYVALILKSLRPKRSIVRYIGQIYKDAKDELNKRNFKGKLINTKKQ